MHELWSSMGRDVRLVLLGATLAFLGGVLTEIVKAWLGAYVDWLRRQRLIREERRQACADLGLALRAYAAFIFSPIEEDPTRTVGVWSETSVMEAARIENPPERVLKPYLNAHERVSALYFRHQHRDLPHAVILAEQAWSGTREWKVDELRGLSRGQSTHDTSCLWAAADTIRSIGKRRYITWRLITAREAAREALRGWRWRWPLRRERHADPEARCMRCSYVHRDPAQML